MQDRPPAPDPDPQRSTLPADGTTGDIGDALESDQPDEALAPDLDSGPAGRDPGGAPHRRDTTEPVPGSVDRDRTEPIAAPGPGPLGSPEHPRTTYDRDRSWTWPLISLAGLLTVVLIHWLANWLPLNDRTTSEVSRANPVPFQPAEWTFLIWPLMYVLLFVFVLHSLLPAGRQHSRIQAVGPLFLLANALSIAWVLLWHWERFAGSLAAIVVLLGSLLLIYGMLRPRGPDTERLSPAQRLLVRVPFSISLGWISIATLVNLEIWMSGGGWDGGPFGLTGWAIIFLLAGTLVAAAFAFIGRDAAYPIVFVWGYAGIAYEQWDTSRLVSVLAGVLAVVAVALTVMAFLLSFDSRPGTSLPAMPRLRGRGTPPAAA